MIFISYQIQSLIIRFRKNATIFGLEICPMRFIKTLLILSCTLYLLSCDGNEGSGSNSSASQKKELAKAPKVNADSVYSFVQKQVNFGPRVPNTKAHKEAASWFKEKFESYGAAVTMQDFSDYVYDGTKVELTNVIASFYPEKKKRILLAAHWDTRPFSDQNEGDKHAPIDGANDGGSGVGVLLEVARVLSQNTAPNIGVDIILFDGEDWGEHDESANSAQLPPGKEVWWCLGSQYWSKNKHKANYSAYYGILLDMVGAPDATFYFDEVSEQNAGRVLTKVWDMAGQIGYASTFKKERGFGSIIDDHVYVNKYANIPMIDIIDHRKDGKGFTPAWHTTNDTMENISRETLAKVANVLMTVLYNE